MGQSKKDARLSAELVKALDAGEAPSPQRAARRSQEAVAKAREAADRERDAGK